jgi:hypothetical protein
LIESYSLLNENNRTMHIFEKNGKYYGQLIKDRTETSPAKFLFETAKFDTIADLKVEYTPK